MRKEGKLRWRPFHSTLVTLSKTVNRGPNMINSLSRKQYGSFCDLPPHKPVEYLSTKSYVGVRQTVAQRIDEHEILV